MLCFIAVALNCFVIFPINWSLFPSMRYLQLSYFTALLSNNEVYVIDDLWIEGVEYLRS